MGKKKKAASRPDVVGMVLITADGGAALGIHIESELSSEMMAATLRQAADQVEGRTDRAAGAWGR